LPTIISYDQTFAPYLAAPPIMALAKVMLGEHLRISFTTGTINYPGNERGGWHADWPFNQRNAGHIPAPYPDATFHLTTLWMFSSFTAENGGTLVVPGSHRTSNNPTGDNGIDPLAPYHTEVHATGNAGSVLLFDSRLWHASAPNRSTEPRVSVVVRYAPWWLNLEVLRPGSVEREEMVNAVGGRENEVPAIPTDSFEKLPAEVRPLFRHWVEQ
jgi:ectoine hydroxylase-related dioxygenase (phytanoyl-CoA dioxygenase family)